MDLSAATLWATLGIFLIIAEIFVPGVWVIWFALPALLVALCSWLFEISLLTQLVIFSVSSGITLILLFVFIKNKYKDKLEPDATQLRGSEYIGKIITLKSAIEDGTGSIKLGDTYWTLQGENCPKGTKIKIIKLNSNMLEFEII
ncbi:hypothetical protein AwWohl_02090 [Gammaproteobacteria bacterium]|nr:hypothetical protein AwWohl_02090 [Gammaproteobacteria bacterium]